MMKQPLQANSANRSRTYYPIETKKNNDPAPTHPPPQAHHPHHPPPQMRIEKVREREIDALRKQNDELRERQEIYIDKLMKLEEGLENQHSEFIKLQELYTELFESYKHKEAEIMELQTKFRESDRYREQERHIEHDRNKDSFRSADSRNKEYSFQEKEWAKHEEDREQQWIAKEMDWQSKEKSLTDYIESLNQKLSTANENYERVVQELSSVRGREKSNSMRAAVSEKTLGELQEWQKQVDNEKEIRLKYQYENEFLKSRNNDLQTQREELQKLLAYKQKEINKLREEKIKIHRQSSQKFIQRSPAKSQPKIIPKPQEQTERSQQRQAVQSTSHNMLNGSLDSNNQYFSFSREKQQYSIDSQLPSFPPQLQIDSLITQHKK